MAEWLGNGLQNRLQQFDSAWYLKKREVITDFSFFVVPIHPSHFVTAPPGADADRRYALVGWLRARYPEDISKLRHVL